jgi:phosphorylase/glycogen(starch) synthase
MRKDVLFEVSWEVCNKVGGINTVLRTKLGQTKKHFGSQYILIGPSLPTTEEFVEMVTPFLEPFKKTLENQTIPCRLGYWDTEEKPSVILIDFRNRYKIDELLYNLWNDFGIDSLASNYDYIEPILFATASAEIISTLAKSDFLNQKQILAHFHEWLCGAGVLYLHKNADQIATIFTTHATVLGRALSGSKRCIYDLSEKFNVIEEAKLLHVYSKHALEGAAIKTANSLTTVSEITGDELYKIFQQYPDKIVRNGLNIDILQKDKARQKTKAIRTKLVNIARKVTGENLSKDALLWVTSGRFEFHNKGYDILLSALAKMEAEMGKTAPQIIVFFLIAAKQYSKTNGGMLVSFDQYETTQAHKVGISTHPVANPQQDLIIRRCDELNLRKLHGKVRIIYSNAYLNEHDGVFNIPYEHILASCDLSIFPSFYEPWGYTPLESIAYGTPTITSNLSGFGNWISGLNKDYEKSVYLLDIKCMNPDKISTQLCSYLIRIASQNKKIRRHIRKKTSLLAHMADWECFYPDYLDAYDQAIEFNTLYYGKAETLKLQNQPITVIHMAENIIPRFRMLQHEAPIPEALEGLRELAYNFWWTWHDEAKQLFQTMNENLWKTVKQNPVEFLDRVTNQTLIDFSNNKAYIDTFNNVLKQFRDYCAVPPEKSEYFEKTISPKNPLAYFCMEYAIDTCLPIYAGGLGILAGDYLKTLSDINIPTVAIGLLYKQGYFTQTIDNNGRQLELYTTLNPNIVPIQVLNDETGKPLLVNIEILGRTVYCRAWFVNVGRVKLYLLDTDTPENNEEDRKITSQLYSGSRETRIMQEIVLGIGGTRLLTEKLKIVPSIYHLNEGHSAFLLLERIKNYFHSGFSFQEAFEIVRNSSVFTTHTPVPAGNETFSIEIIRRHFSKYAELLGTSIDKLIQLAKDEDENQEPIFSMTMLALRFTLKSNAVSSLHGEVARDMWHQKTWPSFLKEEVPISSITNGVHLSTWMAPEMKTLLDRHLPTDWENKPEQTDMWEVIAKIPNEEIWEVHQKLKEKLVSFLKEKIKAEYVDRSESHKLIDMTLDNLRADTFIMTFARRMATYKRADLLLRDKEELIKILLGKEKPATLIFVGKAHPEDRSGKALIQYIIKTMRDPQFEGRIIFLENYTMDLAKKLLCGSDVWLNTPLIGQEACGTSGMKAGMHGVLHLSIQDGWWGEMAGKEAGFDIQSFEKISNLQKRDDLENMDLINTLEDTILPLYYPKHDNSYPQMWVEKMKRAISTITPQFNTHRMATEYYEKLYKPIAKISSDFQANKFEKIKTLSKWKQDITERFNTVKIKSVLITGLKEGKVTENGKVKIKLLLFSGKLDANEIRPEFILIKSDGHQFVGKPTIKALELSDKRKSGILSYQAELTIEDTGFYAYGIRILPTHPLLPQVVDAGIAYWG